MSGSLRHQVTTKPSKTLGNLDPLGEVVKPPRTSRCQACSAEELEEFFLVALEFEAMAGDDL